ncbi:hypothetical protein QQX98_011599 [Neonectria punicea]|uniref:Uncharacterized protein n=1 Tax=Neonectria punicea TaxID=979145 RepID=A0ABR1GLI8_9HYPO
MPLLDFLNNRPLLTLLLSRGADSNLSPHNSDSHSVDRRCDVVLGAAVRLWDPSLVALLVDNGAKLAYARPLHRVVQWMGGQKSGGLSPQRRAMAEYLLLSGIAGVDDVEHITFFDITHLARPRAENLTPFVYACAAQDWDMAEWLSEKGANPHALGGRAFEPMYYMLPQCGPSDPQVVRDLVERMGKR